MSGLVLGKYTPPAGAARFVELAVDGDGKLIIRACADEDTPSVPGGAGLPMLSVRRDADSSSVDADGDFTMLASDEEGRLKVSTKPGNFALVSGVINAVGQTVSADVSRASNVMVMMSTGAVAGHNVSFEGSLDSTNGTDGVWFSVQAVRSNANTVETASGALAAQPVYAWELSVNGLKYVRVRCTAHTSGSATWKMQRGSYATEPIPAAQVSATQPVSGTLGVNNVTTFYNDTVTALAAAGTFTGTSRDLGVSPQTGKRLFVATAFADQAGTLYVDMSNDNTTWRQARKIAIVAGDSAELQVAVVTRYYRARFVNGATAQGGFMLNSGVLGV